MQLMFDGCKSLTELDLSSFNTKNVLIIESMFGDCKKLKTIYASENFKLDKVNSKENDDEWMFVSCYSLVGGNGTIYNSSYEDKTYARIDTEETPGYFTLKS